MIHELSRVASYLMLHCFVIRCDDFILCLDRLRYRAMYPRSVHLQAFLVADMGVLNVLK